MKTAISISDELFNTADKTAKKLSISRSELYQRAIAKYVDEFNDDKVMESLNRAYGPRTSGLDPVLETMQAETIIAETANDSW
ncbi:MAG: ChpI protein [Leptospirales bacterium]